MIDSVRGDILVFIHSQPSDTVSEQQLVQKFGPGVLAITSDMVAKSLLDHDVFNRTFRLQAKGRLEVAEYSQAIQKRRDDEAHKQSAQQKEKLDALAHEEKNLRKTFRHDYRVAIFEAVLAFAVGLMVEYFTHLVELILKIFR